MFLSKPQFSCCILLKAPAVKDFYALILFAMRGYEPVYISCVITYRGTDCMKTLIGPSEVQGGNHLCKIEVVMMGEVPSQNIVESRVVKDSSKSIMVRLLDKRVVVA